jgi:hypothetical protein
MTPNVAASVHQRLLNVARAENRPFNELLQYFTLERFLYRLGRSTYGQQLVLKGALMFGVWEGPYPRPTRDVDLLGWLDNDVEYIVEVVRAICQEAVTEDDGLDFDVTSVSAERITEAAAYHGVRVRLVATLGTARVPFQIDIGFGDILVPGPASVQLPTILDFEPPEMLGYSRESTVAEKFQAMVYLGEVNSRMKDFYDVWFLATRFAFDGPILAQAIRETFRTRQTELKVHPMALTAAFAEHAEKMAQWQAFVNRQPLDSEPPVLGQVIEVIAGFLRPVVEALVKDRAFEQKWSPGGPWRG